MYEKILQQFLLNKEQAAVYAVLLKNGSLPAGKITKKTPLKRGLVYKVLEQLIDFGLVEREKPKGKAAIFKANHPLKLKELAEKMERDAKEAQRVLKTIMPGLVSDFNMVSGKPGIRFFEGIEGLKEIYDDILATGKDFYLVRSIYEPVYTEKMVPVIKDFIKKRVEKGVAVIALTPRDFTKGQEPAQKDDAKILYRRTWIDKKYYDAPVEIDVYGNKVAFLSFGKELIGIIIESPQIAKALKCLFLLGREAAKRL